MIGTAFLILYIGTVGLIMKLGGFRKENFWYYQNNGPSSSVGIATDYGLEGLGSNPGGDEIFRPYRPSLGPTQPPVKWVPGLSWG